MHIGHPDYERCRRLDSEHVDRLFRIQGLDVAELTLADYKCELII